MQQHLSYLDTMFTLSGILGLVMTMTILFVIPDFMWYLKPICLILYFIIIFISTKINNKQIDEENKWHKDEYK